MGKLSYPRIIDLLENERTAAFIYVVRLYLKCRLSYSPRAIIVLFASVLRECPVREDVNPILRGGGDLGEASGIGGATLR